MPSLGLSRLPTPVKVLALVWLLQVAWLGWWFAPEAREAAARLFTGQVGEAVRLEDPFYQWLVQLQGVLPPDSAYVFVDRYEAGQDIIARYHLHPRRFDRLLPTAPPTELFTTLVDGGASYLIIRDGHLPEQWGFLENPGNPAFTRLQTAKPALVYRVDLRRLRGGYYD